MGKTKMKAFVLAALAGLAAAAPSPAISSHVVSHGHGAVVAHGTHAAHGAVPVLAHPLDHAVAHPVAHVAHPVAHAVHHPAVAVAPLHHAVHAAPVAIAHPTPVAHAVHAAPVIAHAAPAYPAPAPVAVVKAAPAYHEPVYKEAAEPYTYTYGVADDYSKANFQAAETSDANGVVSGSYTVALPDGRTQKVTYTADHVNGYVAEVTYEGVPVYPEAKPYVPAPPAPAYHA